MKNRIWLLTGLMVLSINLMVSKQAYAQFPTEFIYNEERGSFEAKSSVPYSESELEYLPDLDIPSFCCDNCSSNYIYEARIISDSSDPKNPNAHIDNGKVVFSVLNRDNDPKSGTCGGSIVKQFLLWVPRLPGRVIPAVEVSIVKDDGIRVTLSTIDPPETMGGWCGPVLCGP